MIRRYLLGLLVGMLTCTTVAQAQKLTSLAAESKTASEFFARIQSAGAVSRADSVLATMAVATGRARDLSHQIPHSPKCLTDLAEEAASISTHEALSVGREILSEPTSQFTMLSQSGRFTIYYDTSGAQACTQDYADHVAQFADSAYDLEIAKLGYPKPAFTNGDSTWHIHVRDLQNGYGLTQPTDQLGFSITGLTLVRSYIVMDNDFSESIYHTHGLDAARITIFHEFHHVIQFADYGYDVQFRRDAYFQEMTSVWMETRSSPDILDYVQYMPAYLLSINQSISADQSFGYGEAVWLQFLQKRYSDDIIKDIWQRRSASIEDPLFATQDALAARGSSFCSDYERFGTALFFTGRRFKGESIFPNAQYFLIDSLHTQLTKPKLPTDISNGAVVASLNYIYTGFGHDTVVVVSARDTDRTVISNGSIEIDGLNSYVAVYQSQSSFCDTIAGYSPTNATVFPQPFIVHSTGTDSVYILAQPGGKPPVNTQVDIFALDMSFVAHIENNLRRQTDSYYAVWNGRDEIGRLVPSGVYFFRVERDGTTTEGKIMVVRKL
jgi:hypothetical protein